MQLFIDIDGVLLNFEGTFVRWLNREYDLGLPEDYEAESWDFEEVLDRQRLQQGWLRFLESREAGALPPLVEPARFNALAREHRVHLVTNFPEPHMEKRLGNLAALGFSYETLHYCGLHAFRDLRPRSKAQVVEALRSQRGKALFVDDHPDNCLDVHRNCPEVEVWLMSRRFNRDFRHPVIRRTDGWEALFQRLGHHPAKAVAGGNGKPVGS
jgi:FMN phosphatase YigB (HAD superfamily)